WIVRRCLPRGNGRLPADVLEVLGGTSLGSQQQAQLLRVGNKLVLVAVSPSTSSVLAVIAEPAEVQSIVDRCRNAAPPPGTPSFFARRMPGSTSPSTAEGAHA
ncbi:MAG TPA: flagellar biosynthetic protein FliO, partial [Pirellulales bacterium]|nr:flagellar biosynthetic protein FliO [Pirellulales bacterium]